MQLSSENLWKFKKKRYKLKTHVHIHDVSDSSDYMLIECPWKCSQKNCIDISLREPHSLWGAEERRVFVYFFTYLHLTHKKIYLWIRNFASWTSFYIFFLSLYNNVVYKTKKSIWNYEINDLYKKICLNMLIFS